MGLFSLLNKSKKQSKSISITNGCFVDGQQSHLLSNCLIAGTKNMGRDSLLRELTVDALNNGKAVFVIQSGTSLPNNTLLNEFSQGWGSRDFFAIDFGQSGFTKPINLFKGSNPDFVQELLILLLTSYKEVSADTRNFVERYLSEIMEIYQISPSGKKFSLSTMRDFDGSWIVSESNRLFVNGLIDSQTRDRHLNYANNLSLYKKEYYEYENFCFEIQKQNFANCMSGAVSYSHLNSQNYITFITLDYITCAKQSTAFLSLFIHKAIQEMRLNKNIETVFVFEDINISTIPECRELFKACQGTAGNNIYFTVDGITNISSIGFDPRSYCNSYFVFRQPIMAEAEEWAKTSGTYKKDKATQTTAPYNQVYGPQNKGFIGGLYTLINGNKQVVTGTNHEIIDEYNITPSEFMGLPDNSSKVIINTSKGKPYIIEVRWA